MTSADLLTALRTILRAVLESRPVDRAVVDSVSFRAVATLYLLLMGHPVDRRGRCLACRRPGAVFGRRRRRCRVHYEARAWLGQPVEFIALQLARELGLPDPRPVADDGPAAAVPPASTAPAPRSPAVPSPPTPTSPEGGPPRAGRPDPAHGAAGQMPSCPRPRCASSADHAPRASAGAPLLTGGPPWRR